MVSSSEDALKCRILIGLRVTSLTQRSNGTQFRRVVVCPGSRDVALLMVKHSSLKQNVALVHFTVREQANTAEFIELTWV